MKPKNVKYSKVQKGMLKSSVSNRFCRKTNLLSFGDFSLVSSETGYVIAKHLDMGKKLLKQFVGKRGLVWCFLFSSKPLTKKPVGVRMGKGKGSVAVWVAPVHAGQIVFELKNVSLSVAKKAFFLFKKKFPLRTGFVFKKKPLV